MVALVFGATGLTGATLLKKLGSDPRFSLVKAVTRRPLPFQHPKIESILISSLQDLASPSQDLTDRLKCDICFCALGTTIKKAGSQEAFRQIDFVAVQNVIRIVEKQKLKCFVLISATGANPHSVVFYNKIKGQTEQLALDSQLLKVVIFRPGLLLGHRSDVRPLELFMVRIAQSLSAALGPRILSSVATDVEKLTLRMIEEALKDTSSKRVIIEARDI